MNAEIRIVTFRESLLYIDVRVAGTVRWFPQVHIFPHMTLSPGTKLGSYEIVAPLGAGGMGVVYRAQDMRLRRHVAIKILPAEFSADRDRLHRFEREARSASALNHPNIVTIYELGQDGSTHYIAMELVEGKTLRELLVAGL